MKLDRQEAKKQTLTISVQPMCRPVEIGYADYAGLRRNKRAIGQLRRMLNALGESVPVGKFGFGPASFFMVLGEKGWADNFEWYGLHVVVTLDGKPVFNQYISPDDPHGVVFKETESPLGMEFGNGTDEWLVAAVRWRCYNSWTPRTLEVSRGFRFDPAKLVIPVFHFAINYYGAENTVLVHDEAIRYDGAITKRTEDFALSGEPRGISVLVLDRDGFRPFPQLMDGMDWAMLLVHSPQMADECDWSKLDGDAWAELLAMRPEFAERCDKWEAFSGEDWVRLLSRRPEFADRCDKWESFRGENWATLLSGQPRFADRCDWSKFTTCDWVDLLKYQPGFADRCPWTSFNGINWAILLEARPEFADRCDWTKLPPDWWWKLLHIQPQFADRCNSWQSFSGFDWACLLSRRPEFADRCDWTKLEGWNWADLLAEQPQFAKFRPKE